MKSKTPLVLQNVASRHEASDDEPLLELNISESDAEDAASESPQSESSFSSQPLSSGVSDSEIDIDLEAKRPGEIGSLAQQAKILRRELQRTQISDDESEEVEDSRLGWGSRRHFYGTNEEEKQDEDMKEDLEETLELQRAELEQLHDADFEIPVVDAEKDAELVEKAADVVLSDGDELASLCTSLKASLDELRFKIGPLLEEARKGDLCTEQGLSYLEAKHLLLLHYWQCLIFYVLLKLEGRSVKNHPAVLRLVEIRTYLEKLRPIEARLQPQVDKLLRAISIAQTAEDANDGEEEERLAPHPEELIPKSQDENGIYRPPKLHPVAMDDPVSKKKRKSKGKKKEPAEDVMVSEIVREWTGAPEELSSSTTAAERMKSILAERQDAEWAEQEEEASYSRKNTSKDTKKRMAHAKSRTFGGVSFEDFAADIQSTMAAIQDTTKQHHFSVELEKHEIPSGDADLPFPRPKERDHAAVDEAVVIDSDVDEAPPAKKPKKSSEKQTSHPPKLMKKTTGRRAISEMIQKNRGLTPHRTKERKNPRRRHRLQFETKEKRRKGHLQQPFSEAPDHYGGEATGISKRVKKSVRFA